MAGLGEEAWRPVSDLLSWTYRSRRVLGQESVVPRLTGWQTVPGMGGKGPVPHRSYTRRGGRVVEGAGLENRYIRKGIAGSNPALSAIVSRLSVSFFLTLCQFFYVAMHP